MPSEQIDRVGRYIGPSAQPPTLSRLGTQEWSRAKRRVREATEELAKELDVSPDDAELVKRWRFYAALCSTWLIERPLISPVLTWRGDSVRV